MQEPERSHGPDTHGDDHDRERDGRAEENALDTVQLPFRSRHSEIRPTEVNVTETAPEGSERGHKQECRWRTQVL
jgi:hypothetical protein